MTDKDNIQYCINLLEGIKKKCFKTPNQYYVKGAHPTEYNYLVTKNK